MKYIVVLLLLANAALSQAAEQQLEVITLQHRLAAELLPSVQPFVDQDGAISATGNQLIIRASAQNLEQLRKLIEQLDLAARRLLIEVRQPLANDTSASHNGISGQIGSDNDNSVTLRSYATTSRDTAVSDQQIQVLEGHSALIKSGTLVPLAKKQIRDGRQEETVIEQQDISSGFQVTPRLRGEIVELDIMPFASSPASGGAGAIHRQQALTTISGKLGEWLEIGGITQQQSQTAQGTTYSSHSRNEQGRRIMIRVTELQ